MTLFNPCITGIGPKNARIVLVGEAPGEQEEMTGIAFIGNAGQELNRLFAECGLERSEIYLTNVLWTRPPNNKLEAFCVPKSQVPPGYSLPPLSSGKYLHPDLLPELARLSRELREIRPNLIIAAGGTASWALVGNGKIGSIRGTIHESSFGKVLPTYHPSYLFKDWSLRVVIKADLIKARLEAGFREIRRPVRYVTHDPTLTEVEEYCKECLNHPLVALDVETYKRTITHLGLAYNPTELIVVPFFDRRKPGGSYWSRDEEVIVRMAIGTVTRNAKIKKITQNGIYDIQYLLEEGYALCNFSEDTMLQQHALYPEMPKSLGFLGSIHTNEVAWKKLRPRGKDAVKRED
jgi:DNA polymerase